jgi:two-component system, NarL family, sensor kinase
MDSRIIIIIGATCFSFTIVLFFFTFIIKYQKKSISFQIEKKLMQTQFHQALLQTQLEIQEQTLKTISEEIHDNIGQILSLAKLNLNTFPENTEPEIQTKINDTKHLVSKAINDLRDLSRSLHGDKITELGLEAAVTNELKIVQNTGQFQTQVSSTGNQYKLEPQKQMVLFRMVQESLNNAIKHSKAKNITVQFQYEPAIFRLTIADNGIGFNAANLLSTETGIGLKSMQNRAALIGAVFSVYSTNENGTQINIELPIQQRT